MDYQHNFDPQNVNVQPKCVFQDVYGTSPYWRNNNRNYHPVTENQMTEKNFRVGDHLRMRITHPNNTRTLMDLNVVNIIPYRLAQQVLGSYNANDAFGGAPFAHVLVLEP